MKSLQAREQQFQDYLLHANPEIIQHTVSTDKVPAEMRLDIYANAYRSRLHEVLVANYPVLAAYLGTEAFENLSYAYIAKHPSSFRSIRWFGDQLADFLTSEMQNEPYSYIAELAQLEWNMAAVFDAADGEVFLLESMATIPPEAWVNMRLQIHPTVRRLALAWNVVQIWQTVTDEQTPAEPQQSDEKVEWILWRKELMSHFSSLNPDEAWALDAANNGKTFSEICEGLCFWHAEDDVSLRAASLLKGWITAGLISAVEI